MLSCDAGPVFFPEAQFAMRASGMPLVYDLYLASRNWFLDDDLVFYMIVISFMEYKYLRFGASLGKNTGPASLTC